MEDSKLVRLSAVLTKEDNLYVAYNPETGVASQGKTKVTALKNLREAVELYFEDDPIGLPKERQVVELKVKVKAYA